MKIAHHIDTKQRRGFGIEKSCQVGMPMFQQRDSQLVIYPCLNLRRLACDGDGIDLRHIIQMLAAAIDDQRHLGTSAQQFVFSGCNWRGEEAMFQILGKCKSDQRAIRLAFSLGAENAKRLLAHQEADSIVQILVL